MGREANAFTDDAVVGSLFAEKNFSIGQRRYVKKRNCLALFIILHPPSRTFVVEKFWKETVCPEVLQLSVNALPAAGNIHCAILQLFVDVSQGGLFHRLS